MQVPRLALLLAAACAAASSSLAYEFSSVAAGANAPVGGAAKFTVSTENSPESPADGGYEVGSSVAVNAADYAITQPCQAQKWTITQKKASSIALQFSSVSLPQGDALVAVAQNGVEVPVATDGGETTTSAVPGSTISLEYRPSPSCSASAASFSLDSLVLRYTTVAKEAVCGVNTMQNVKCFANSTLAEDAKMYQLSKAVLRTQRVREDGKIVVCTAWLWGNKGHLVTNNHCFSSQAMVDAAQFDFGVEASSCAAKCQPGSCPITRSVKGKANVKFIASDPTLDIALLQITSSAASEVVSTFGYLRILFGMPTVGEEIYIPQHPGGGARQIAKTDDDSNKSIATIKAVNAAVDVDSTTYTGLIGYSADTESGSSGSPVISRSSNLVVGLHRIGYCNNAATPSKSLLAYLVPLAKANDGLYA